MIEERKKLLKEVEAGKKIADYLDKNFLVKGKNILDVKDKAGKFLRKKVVIWTGDDSKVQKSMQDETDIKNILKKYGRTGMLPIMQDQQLYGDFSSMPEYQEAQNIIIKAERQFSLLSSDVRKKFDNDPAKFLQFCTNKDNLNEMYKLGLAIEPEAEPGPIEVVVTNQGDKA